MKDTVSRYLAGFPDSMMRRWSQFIINPLADRFSTQMLASAGLVIKAGGSTLAKTGGSIVYALAQGTLVKIAAATDMAALSGTVTNAKFNAFVFYIDSAGTITSAMGTEGATLAAMVLPEPPVGKAIVGFVIINPTGTGNFVGGTTALDDATVVPNAAYVSPAGPWDQTVLLGVAS